MLFIGCFDSTLALYTMNSLFFQILKLSEVLIQESEAMSPQGNCLFLLGS
jgi:hypothetical protein